MSQTPRRQKALINSMDTKEHWDSVYKLRPEDEVSWYQEEPTLSLSLIDSLNLDKQDSLIDVGGGASSLVDHLIAAGFNHITVLDLSATALSIAKERLGDSSNLVNWKTEDVTNYAPDHRFSLWHDRAVFHFLTDRGDRVKYRKAIEASVKEGGYVIIAAFAIGGPTKCSGLDIVQYDAVKLERELGPGFKLIDERSEQHLTPAGITQSFRYFVFERVAA